MDPIIAVKKNTLMAILTYIGPLVIVSYLTAKDDPFVKFHIKQGLVLFTIEIIVWLLGMLMWQLWMILNVVNLIVILLSIVGIVRAAKGEEKMLPVIGHWSKYFTI